MGSTWDSSPLTLLKSFNTGFAPYLYFLLSRSFRRILPVFPWVDSAVLKSGCTGQHSLGTEIPISSKCWRCGLIREQTQNELEHPNLGTKWALLYRNKWILYYPKFGFSSYPESKPLSAQGIRLFHDGLQTADPDRLRRLTTNCCVLIQWVMF